MRTVTAVAGNRVSMVRAALDMKVAVEFPDGEAVKLSDAGDLWVVGQSPAPGAEVEDDATLRLIVARPAL